MFGRKKNSTPENPQQAPAVQQPAAPAPQQQATPAPASSPPPAPAPSAGAAELSDEEKKKRSERIMKAKMVAAAFGEIVTIFMRSADHRQFSIADLEWLVAPAVLTGQFVLAEARNKEHVTTPVGIVLWASVSPEVDARLSANPGEQPRLTREEWKSGDILWIIEAIGHDKVLKGIIDNLHQKVFRGRPAKFRGKDENGNRVIKAQQLPAAAAPQA